VNKSIAKSYPHLLIPVGVVLLHLLNSAFTTYGYFRDELYYIACSNHPGFGYVDQPPLSIFILSLNRLCFGDSLLALRLLPALAHGVTVWLAGLLAGKLGGSRFAQLLAALTVAVAPGLVGMFGYYSMNAFDIMLWPIAAYLLVRLNETEKPQYWIWIGVIVGLGLLNKLSMGWLAAGIAVGVVATPMRRWVRTPYPWIAAGISLLLFLPYIIWNLQHELAHLEFMRNAAGAKYASQTPETFLLGMILHFHPLALPVWLAGFWVLLRKNAGILGIAVLTVLAILLINIHSKTEYFNPAAVLLLAAGAVQVERWCASPRLLVPGRLYAALIALTGCLLLPFALDLLPVNAFVSYSEAIGVSPSNTEGKRMGSLPQHYADRFGWKELADDVASVFKSLPAEEQSRAKIYAQNYGEASAISFFGRKLGLPEAISGHNSYWLWGCGSDSVGVVIIVGGERLSHLRTFARVEQAAVHSTPQAMPYENGLPIFVCRGMRVPIRDAWRAVRNYD
jgi:4-amino-4-deoxy-L-arabinose transferase-like glycosyltransferase